MSRFSKRNMLLFVTGLLVGTLLIGFGIAYVIQLKQQILPNQSSNTHRQSRLEAVLVEL
jgi:predicted RND superfamily exporter protein